MSFLTHELSLQNKVFKAIRSSVTLDLIYIAENIAHLFSEPQVRSPVREHQI